jgi:predicted HicB family RNase H-like nuclease
MAQLNIEIPDHLHRSLKLEAIDQGKTLKALVLDLLSSHMLRMQIKRAPKVSK